MKKNILLVGLTCFYVSMYSQTIQYGSARELNSDQRPLSNVFIKIEDAVPTNTDSKGLFRLVFDEKKPGDIIFLNEIKKKGYELVNTKDFEILKISRTDQLGVDIILAKTGVIDAAKKEYFGISDQVLLEGFEKEKKALRRQLQKSEVNQENFENQLRALQDKYNRQKASLDALADKFARTNFDDIEPSMAEALQLFKKGKIDEAIGKIESVDPVERTRKIIQEEKRLANAQEELDKQKASLDIEKQNQIQAVRLLAEMYSVKFNVQKAETQFDQLILLDSTNLSILLSGADFFWTVHRYDKAIKNYQRIIRHPDTNPQQIAAAHGFIGDMNIATGSLVKAEESYLIFHESFEKLAQENPESKVCKTNFAISYEKLGEAYTQLGKLDQALDYFKKEVQIFEDLAEDDSASIGTFEGLAIAYSKLGDTYVSLGKYQHALYFFVKYQEIAQTLFDTFPQSRMFKDLLSTAYSRLGTTYASQGMWEEAFPYLKERFTLIKELYEEIPQNIEFKNGLAVAYSQLGDAYNAMGKLVEAADYYNNRIRLGKELQQAYPQNIEFGEGLAKGYSKLGSIYLSQNQPDSARINFEKAAYIYERLYATSSTNSLLKEGLAISYEKMGDVHAALGNHDLALGFFEMVIQLFEELSEQTTPKNIGSKHSLAIAHAKVGIFQKEKRNDKTNARRHLLHAKKLWEEIMRETPQPERYQPYHDKVKSELLKLKE